MRNIGGTRDSLADYPFRLFCVNEMEDFSVFQTELQDVFNLMRYRKNKKKMLQLIEENPKYQIRLVQYHKMI